MGMLDSKHNKPLEHDAAHELPDGWFQMSDSNSGATYYAHPESMTSQWEPPSRSDVWYSTRNLPAIEVSTSVVSSTLHFETKYANFRHAAGFALLMAKAVTFITRTERQIQCNGTFPSFPKTRARVHRSNKNRNLQTRMPRARSRLMRRPSWFSHHKDGRLLV